MNTPSARPPRSKSLISSPCSRMIWPIRPGPGSSRCRAASASRNSREPPTAPTVPVPPLGHVEAGRASERNVSRSSSGRPSSSQITRNGIGNAKVGTRSTTPSSAAAARSISSSWCSTIAVDAGPQPLEPAHRELGGQQLAQPGVLGRVGEAEAADVAVGGRAALAHVGADVGGVRRACRPAPRAPRRRRSPARRRCRGTRSACAPGPRRAPVPRRGGRRHHVPVQRPGQACRAPCRAGTGRCRPSARSRCDVPHP